MERLEHLTLTVTEDGDLLFIDSAAGRELAAAMGETILRRASHVVPYSFLQRVLFKAVRFIVRDDSSTAQWTRAWDTLWIIDLSPVGGKTLPLIFTDRDDAIRFEIEFLNRFFLNR